MSQETEQQFLKSYSLEDYERPSVTADVAAFTLRSKEGDSYRKEPEKVLSLLLIRRGGHPFKGMWALPGGFLQKGETIEQCAVREIAEETGVQPTAIMLTGIYSAPDRDPRGWIISGAFTSVLMDPEITPEGGDDAADARWFDVSFTRDEQDDTLLKLCSGDITLTARLRENTGCGQPDFRILEQDGIAFDHAAMIAAAMCRLRQGAENFSMIFDFLPETFTLSQMQQVQETILNISVLQPNFRRKAAEYVVETDAYTSGAGHRPAKLYRKK